MGAMRSAAVLGAMGLGVAAWVAGCARGNPPGEGVASTSAPILSYPSSQGTVDYSGSPTGANLLVASDGMHAAPITVYLVFYGADWAAGDQQLVRDFIDGLSGSPLASTINSYNNGEDVELTSSFARSTSEYWDQSYLSGNNLTQTQIGQVVQKGVTLGKFPADINALYIVLPDDKVNAVSPFPGRPFCSAICGYHPTTTSGLHMPFALSPAFCNSPGQAGGCNAVTLPAGLGGYPNGTNGYMDETLNTVWHEIAEEITDPDGRGWFVNTSTGGAEVATETADQCEGYTLDGVTLPMVGMAQYDFLYTTAAGTAANTHLGSGATAHDYILQPLWQNEDRGGCVRRLLLNRPAAIPTKNAGIGAATGDLDGNGIADLMWRDTSTGEVTASLLGTGDSIIKTRTIPDLAAQMSLQIYGLGDFNGDGAADTLWRTNIDNEMFLMYGGGPSAPLTVKAGPSVASGLTPKELIKAIGDFDGNGKDDILFQNTDDNSTRIAFNPATSTVTISSATHDFTNLTATSPAASQSDDSETVGTGDFDDDGTSELLWHNLSAGGYRTWKFTDPNHTGHPTHVTSTSLTLTGIVYVVGIVDVDRDGTADLVGEDNTSNPHNLVWVRMQNGLPAGAAQVIHAYPDQEWRFSGGSRFSTGQTGLLWYNRETGALARWIVDSTGAFVRSDHIVASEPMSMQLISN